MRTYATAAGVICAVLSMACGSSSSSPTAPSSPTAQVWTLSGTVTAAAGAAIAGATVTIADGPNAGQSRVTDANGKYAFTGLQAAGFSATAGATGFQTATKPVTLTTNQVVDFALTPTAVAVFTLTGNLEFTVQPDGHYIAHGSAVNSGNACAAGIAGVTTLSTKSGGEVARMPWTMPPSTTVRPGGSLAYDACCATADQLVAIGPDGTYFTTITFSSAVCQ